MLNQGTVIATVAVRDMAAAREFYGNVLDLTQTDENLGGVGYSSGQGRLFIYESPNGGQNPATSCSWVVSDVEATVEDLKSRGVTFEHYDDMPVEWQGDIAVMEGMKTAWFKDPDGNILAVSTA